MQDVLISCKQGAVIFLGMLPIEKMRFEIRSTPFYVQAGMLPVLNIAKDKNKYSLKRDKCPYFLTGAEQHQTRAIWWLLAN